MRLSLLVFLLACQSESVDTANTVVPDDGVPELPVSRCAEGHEWLSTHAMGEIIQAERDASLSLSQEVIQLLLESNGLSEYGPVENGVDAWKVRYTTQDKGQAIEATGFVFLPSIEAPQDFPVLLYTHPLMGFNDQCAPTANGLEGGVIPLLMSSMGFVVAAPDYLGMRGFGEGSEQLHPAIVAEPTAIVSIDNLRAATNLAEQQQTLAQPDPSQTLLWGASEGGFAALWSDRYLPRYAPQFESIGVVAAIPPTDILALAQIATADLSTATAALTAVLIGMDQWYGHNDLNGVVNERLIDVLPVEMMESCDEYPSVQDASTTSDFFDDTFIAAASKADWDTIDPWSCFLDENSLASATMPYESQAPVLIITAEDDDLAWPGPVHDDIPELCEQGYAIEHVQCAGADHVAGAIETLPVQVQWLKERAQGIQPNPTCTVAPPQDCNK